MVFVAIDSNADFLVAGVNQSVRQLLAVGATLLVAISSGYLTGIVMKKTTNDTPADYDDAVWWKGEYFDEERRA